MCVNEDVHQREHGGDLLSGGGRLAACSGVRTELSSPTLISTRCNPVNYSPSQRPALAVYRFQASLGLLDGKQRQMIGICLL